MSKITALLKSYGAEPSLIRPGYLARVRLHGFLRLDAAVSRRKGGKGRISAVCDFDARDKRLRVKVPDTEVDILMMFQFPAREVVGPLKVREKQRVKSQH